MNRKILTINTSKHLFHKGFTFTVFILLVLLFIFDIQSGRNFGGSADSRGKYQLIVVFIQILLTLNFIFYVRIIIKSKNARILFLLSILIFAWNFTPIINGAYYIRLTFLYSLLWLNLFAFGFNYNLYNKLSKKCFLNFIIVLFLISIYSVLSSFLFVKETRDAIFAPGIYSSLVFFPWILILKNGKMKKIFISLLVVLVILSLKRGAILALVLMLLASSFYSNKISKEGNFFKLTIKFFALLLVLFVLFFTVNKITNNYFLQRFSYESMKDGSGRADSNEIALNAIIDSSLSSLILGQDTNNLNLEGFLGHNDWLSFMLNYGLVGVFLFSLLNYKLYKNSRFLLRIKHSYAPAYIAAFVMFLLMSLYSTSYFPAVHPIAVMLFFGFVEGEIHKIKKTNRNMGHIDNNRF